MTFRNPFLNWLMTHPILAAVALLLLVLFMAAILPTGKARARTSTQRLWTLRPVMRLRRPTRVRVLVRDAV